MPTHDELMAAKDRAATVLLRLPNVTSVGIGGRVRAGQRIPELVLKVYVDAKVPADQLAAADRIPAEIEGLPTDVVQMPTVGTGAVATPAPPGQPAIPFANRDQDKKRPLLGGTHMEGGLSENDYMGTLGCIMISTTDATKAYAFTNWHVMQGQNQKDPTIGQTKAGQPTNKESSTKCCSHIIGTLTAGERTTSTDAALIALQPGMQWQADVVDIGPLADEHPVDGTEAGTHPAVRKRGARSRLSGGVIDSIGTPVTVDGMSYSNAMIIMPNLNPTIDATDPVFFGQHGDSGSVVVNDSNHVVGIFFALPNGPYAGRSPAGRCRLPMSRAAWRRSRYRSRWPSPPSLPTAPRPQASSTLCRARRWSRCRRNWLLTSSGPGPRRGRQRPPGRGRAAAGRRAARRRAAPA